MTFGQINPRTGRVISTERLAASPVQMAELRVNGKPLQTHR